MLSRVVDDAVAHLPGQIETFSVVFELIDHAQALLVVGEILGIQLLHSILAGVTERCMSQVVPHRRRLGEILVEAKCPGNDACDLRDLQGVRQPRAVMIARRC